MAGPISLTASLWALSLVRRAGSQTCSPEQYQTCKEEFAAGTINWLCGSDGDASSVMLKWCEEMARSFNERDPLQQVTVTKAENFGDFGGMMIDDQDTGLNLYNVYFHAMGLYVGSRGHLWADLTDMVRAQQDGLRWDKVGSFFQQYGALWESKVKIMPLDGDFHSLFYRLDLFEEYNISTRFLPGVSEDMPADKTDRFDMTLEEFVEIGEFFHGKDLNGDGEPDFGICFPHNGYASPYYFLGLLAPWLQYEGSSQGIFFDPETMEPLFDNAAAHKVIRLWKRTWMIPDPMDAIPVGPGSTIEAIHAGRCAMSLGWDELFTLQRRTWASGKIGVAKVPGTTHVWDRSLKELTPCTQALCPYALKRADGSWVNFAPYNAFNGFSMAINGASSPAQVNTAFALMAFLMNEDNRQLVVVDGLQFGDNQSTFFSAVNPDVYDVDRFVQAGFGRDVVDTFVKNGKFSITSDNTALELRFTGDTMQIYGDMMALMYDYYREQGEYNTTGQGGAAARAMPDEEAAAARVASVVQSMWAENEAKDPVAFRATYHKMLGIYDGPAACRYGERFVAATDTCEVCPAGRFGSYDKLNCRECSAGSASSQAGMTICRECVPGTYQNASGQELCLNCTAGRYSEEAARSECIECPVGRHFDGVRAEECTICPVGTYQSLPGQRLCADCPQGQITSEWVLVQGQYQWVPMGGADNVSVCGCSEGTRLLDGECVNCGVKELDGLVCRGKDDVVVAEGFYAADTSFSIFKCHGHANRCVGGKPGRTCAAGREDISCAQCEIGFKANSDGTCVLCDTGGTGKVNFIVFSICSSILLLCLYVIVDRGRGTRPSHIVLLLTLTFSMTVTLVQQLGIISLFEDVEWTDPILSLLRIMQLLVLDIEVLNVNCVVRMSPLETFVMQVSALGLAVAVLFVAHAVLTLIFHKGAFASRMPSLLASIGTIFLALYISVVTSVLGPFQCLSHPNGERTVRAFPSVICWETGEHHTMVAIAALAVQVPLGFYAYCFLAVWKYPKRMSEGNTAFLQVHNWLFFRFKPQVYWYSIVFMTRSLLLAVVPVIPNSRIQIVSMDIILITQLMLVVGEKPWRLETVNALDNFFTVCMLLILICAAFYIDWVSATAIAWFASFLVVACLVVLPIISVLVIVVWLSAKQKKKFDYFLCHHKVGAGAFTRLLKLQLKASRTKLEVFVDADNLATLDTLFDFVANQTSTLVMVGSKHLLQRPWCMGEITTAKAAKIQVFKLALPDFSNPTDEFIDNYADIVGDLAVLTNNGIALSDAQEAIRWFRELREVSVPVELDDEVLKEVSKCVMQSTYTMVASTRTKGTAGRGSDGKIKIIADTQSWEACSAAILVSRLLAPHFASRPEYIPQVLHSGEAIPETATQGLLICSAGALEKEQLLHTLAAARYHNLPIVPILVEDGFQFPSKDFVEEHRSLISRRGAAGSSIEEVDASLDHVQEIFMTIGIGFPAKMASEKALHTKADEIAHRLRNMIDADMGSARQIRGAAISSRGSHSSDQDTGDHRLKEVDENENSGLRAPGSSQADDNVVGHDAEEGPTTM